MLTPDQITRVKEAIADLQMEAADNRNSGFTDEADRFDAHAAALSALLQERETLRAALRRLWVDPPCHPGGRQCRDRYGDREAWCMTCTGELDALLTPRED